MSKSAGKFMNDAGVTGFICSDPTLPLRLCRRDAEADVLGNGGGPISSC